MRLISCHIENFGKLTDITVEFDSELNIICRENGWGKSTLASFIKVMLYGFDNESKRDAFTNERKRFTPWQGGVYGGSLCVETKGVQIEVRRIFGKKESEDRCEIRNLSTNLECEDLDKNLGVSILGIDSEAFMRTAYIMQGECKTLVTGSINAKLGNLAQNTDDINNFESADLRLKDVLNSMSPDRKTGQLYKLERRISELSISVPKLKELELSVSDGGKKLENDRLRLESLKKRRYEVQNQQIQAGIFRENQAKLKEYELLCRECDERENNLKLAGDSFKGKIPERKEIDDCMSEAQEITVLKKSVEMVKNSKNSSVMAVSVIVLAVAAGMIKYFADLDMISFSRAIPALVVVLLVLGSFIIIKGRKKIPVSSDEKYLQRIDILEKDVVSFIKKYDFEVADDIVTQLRDINGRLSAYKVCLDEFNKALERKQKFENAYELGKLKEVLECEKQDSFEMLISEVKRLDEEIDLLQADIRRQEEAITRLNESLEYCLNDVRELELLKKKYGTEYERYKIIGLTRKYLAAAKESFTSRYMEPLLRAFGKYFCMLSDSDAGMYRIDANSNLTVDEKGMQRDIRFLSKGLGDLTGLCMRMALIDVMYPGEKPFIIMDDPFVNLDDAKRELAKKFIRIVSGEYQIIFFSATSDISPAR